MNQIDTLVLDYGGVISLPISHSTLQELYKLVFSGGENLIDFESFIKIYYSNRSDFDKGLVSGEIYWEGIAKNLKLSLNREQIVRLAEIDLNGWAGFSEPMLEAIKTLSSKLIDLVLLTNMSIEMKEYLLKNAPWMNKFKKHIFSCDHNIIKPDHKIYYETLRISGKDASQVLFVDDTLENIIAAREIGIKALHYVDSEDIAEIFKCLEIN